MNTLKHVGRTALVMLLVSSGAHAGGKLTWFGETTFTGAYPVAPGEPAVKDPTLRSLVHGRPGWGSASRIRLLENQLAVDTVFDGADTDHADNRTMRSELGVSLGDESLSVPLSYRQMQYHNGDARQLDSYGFKWRHQFKGIGSLTVAKQYGKGAYQFGEDPLLNAANTVTSVSWTSGFEHSGVTGSLYIGDERIIETESADSQRRVYGFAVGGHWNLGSEHTPYVSLRYQTSDQSLVSGLTEYDDRYTRISAGWNWQVHSNWQVRAEANFTYDEPRWNLLHFDRTRIQFSTRFDIE